MKSNFWTKERARWMVGMAVIALAFWGVGKEVQKIEQTAHSLASYVQTNCKRQEASRKYNDKSITVKTQILPIQGSNKETNLNKSILNFNKGQEKAYRKLKELEPKVSSTCKGITP